MYEQSRQDDSSKPDPRINQDNAERKEFRPMTDNTFHQFDLHPTLASTLAELGLTPAAQKRLTNDAPKKEKLSPLAKALSEIK